MYRERERERERGREREWLAIKVKPFIYVPNMSGHHNLHSTLHANRLDEGSVCS
jgi:hypothetical protein